MTEKTLPDRFAEMQALAETASDPYELNSLLTEAENAEWRDIEDAASCAGEAWAERQNEIRLYGLDELNPMPQPIEDPAWLQAFTELWNGVQAKAFAGMAATDDSDIPF